MSEPVLTFGPFELHPTQRLLLESGAPVRLGSRAMDILLALTQRAGEVVGKADLIAAVWPGIHVEETNLRVHVAALRKALGDGRAGKRFIANLPGRGYCFVAPVDVTAPGAAPTPRPAEPALGRCALPMQLTRVIGRDGVIESVTARLRLHRFVTIVGPGGIGKTTVAVATAAELLSSFADGIVFVDLAPIADPALVAGTIASVIGVPPHAEGPVAGIVSFVRDRTLLLVLDNCEHVTEAVAPLAESILRGAGRMSILATTREALRAEGEWVQRLPPLGVPPAGTTPSAEEALRFPAVELFVERAAASLGGYALADADAPVVAEICRRLDGIALAIEFAAGRLDAFGLRKLASLLKDRLDLLTRGRRAALPRHQTLRATLDWSYGILPEPERLILRRLAVFSGAFSLASARQVIADDQSILGTYVNDGLASLVSKSLVAVETTGREPQYRLLETTRAYASEKLDESGETTILRRRHAEHLRTLLEEAEAAGEREPLDDRLIEDLHGALRWAFGPGGDVSLGIALTIAAVPLWFQTSLLDECLNWIERALAELDPASQDPATRRRRMQLYLAAPGFLHMYAQRRLVGGAASWETALRLAEDLGDVEAQMRALWALWGYKLEHGAFQEALTCSERFCNLAPRASDPMDRFVGERMSGATLHFLGRQDAALKRIDGMLAQYTPPAPRSHLLRFRFDQRIAATLTRVRILWLQGSPDQALREVGDAFEAVCALQHKLMLGSTLIQAACPVALLSGDLVAAERYGEALRSATVDHPLEIWRAFSQGFAGEIMCRRGHFASGLRLLEEAIGALRRVRFTQYITTLQAALARGLIGAGKPAHAMDVVHDALGHCEQGGEEWALAEFLRIRGEALLRLAREDASTSAEAAFQASLAVAKAQGARSWELRSATSLAELWIGLDRPREAIDLLAPILARFTEGFGTADLVAAAGLLHAIDRRESSRPRKSSR